MSRSGGGPICGTEPLKTWFWADPENDLVFVGMVQRLMGPGFPSLQPLAQDAVRKALTRKR